jgi:hypothetical protein
MERRLIHIEKEGALNSMSKERREGHIFMLLSFKTGPYVSPLEETWGKPKSAHENHLRVVL